MGILTIYKNWIIFTQKKKFLNRFTKGFAVHSWSSQNKISENAIRYSFGFKKYATFFRRLMQGFQWLRNLYTLHIWFKTYCNIPHIFGICFYKLLYEELLNTKFSSNWVWKIILNACRKIQEFTVEVLNLIVKK